MKFFEKIHSNRVIGRHWPLTRGIDIFKAGRDIETVVHELAHHCQHERGDKIIEGVLHIGSFYACENEIKIADQEKKVDDMIYIGRLNLK